LRNAKDVWRSQEMTCHAHAQTHAPMLPCSLCTRTAPLNPSSPVACSLQLTSNPNDWQPQRRQRRLPSGDIAADVAITITTTITTNQEIYNKQLQQVKYRYSIN